MTTLDILKRTKAAWPSICNASAEDKNRILSALSLIHISEPTRPY